MGLKTDSTPIATREAQGETVPDDIRIRLETSSELLPQGRSVPVHTERHEVVRFQEKGCRRRTEFPPKGTRNQGKGENRDGNLKDDQ